MKRILITGANSYIGTSFERYLQQWPVDYQADTLDMHDKNWRGKTFAEYDAVVHVAGIVHRKETKGQAALYYKINRDLTAEVAAKAKKDGAKQFVFLSTMSVYGMKTGVITRSTVPAPSSNYGKSKLEAEALITKLAESSFKVAVLRPPMVYGKGCKGNYQKLAKFAKTSPVFPDCRNQRSMIFIDNLCDFIKFLVDSWSGGLFFPQNEQYVTTTDLAREISKISQHKIRFIRLFNPVLNACPVSMVEKAFGTLIYEDYDSAGKISFSESIHLTEE